VLISFYQVKYRVRYLPLFLPAPDLKFRPTAGAVGMSQGEMGETEDIGFKTRDARVCMSVSDSRELAVNLTPFESYKM